MFSCHMIIHTYTCMRVYIAYGSCLNALDPASPVAHALMDKDVTGGICSPANV